MRMARISIQNGVLLLCIALLALSAGDVWSQGGYGSIVGRVADDEGNPVAYAQVVVLGQSWGAMGIQDGTYIIKNVNVGTYDLKVMMMGYEDKTITGVVIRDGENTKVDFKIKRTLVDIDLEEVVVKGRRQQLIKKESAQGHNISSDQLTNLPVDELEEAISLKAGVVAQAGELHFRGGRAGEVQYQVDGVPVRDPLVGGGVALATLAISDSDIILGGLDAQYGNAQSGIVNYKTKEGGDEFEGELRYITDDYGQPDNTYDNLDRMFVGFGGPSPIRNLTYYISAEGTYQDDYPKTIENRTHRNILNFISVGDRKDNSLKMQGKLAYRPNPKLKMTLEVINNHTKRDNYLHAWSREGYVETFFDTTQTGTVMLRHGAWSPTQIDSTYLYYNAAEHTPNVIDDFNQLKFVLNHTIDKDTYYSLKLSRQYFFRDNRVLGKEPWEYTGDREADLWLNYRTFESYDYFVIAGDYPTLSTRKTQVYTTKGDFTRRLSKKQMFQTGFEFSYNDMYLFQVDRPYQTNTNGEIGGSRTRYHYYNPEGAVYTQSRWEHEGMVLNIGLRYDAFSVGDQIPISEVQKRVKTQFSPRIGIAYPISDRDVFSFHYGRFYQSPDRQYIFDDRNVFDGRTRGNPNLENETTVSYQAGIQHLFSEIVFGQFSVYYKDIFGLITAEQVPDYAGTGNVRLYTNKDYASARGFEFTLSRQFKNNFRGEISYTYGVATGVASDPNAAIVQNFLYLPVSEQPLDWDSRHQLSAQLYIANPGSWGCNFVWNYTSGFPYTPIQRNTRELGPEATNSRRLPGSTSLDIQAEKYYTLWNQRFRIFLQSRNLLDAKNITNLTPSNWPGFPSATGSDYEKYYTETGRAGGAYIGDDINGDGIEDWIPLQDPRVFGDPRTIRVGVGFQF
ncbi:MAG: TonB-dependent receptor [Candidatus Eisenbacteria bacterium]|uniref:TonB-dependent receptor n=1 Tax=Eiseniibacteriota bacterium TaxID=2212470 RepID=A0A948RTT7_UNCEI|nr:TonB-dependent receptor [Candidatus Eisenbacteria bacterium]